MARSIFAVDHATLEAISDLKRVFGAKTNADVVRKALALAQVAAENADPSNNTLTILTPERQFKKVHLAR
jgi:hypothetical protein